MPRRAKNGWIGVVLLGTWTVSCHTWKIDNNYIVDINIWGCIVISLLMLTFLYNVLGVPPETQFHSQ